MSLIEESFEPIMYRMVIAWFPDKGRGKDNACLPAPHGLAKDSECQTGPFPSRNWMVMDRVEGGGKQ